MAHVTNKIRARAGFRQVFVSQCFLSIGLILILPIVLRQFLALPKPICFLLKGQKRVHVPPGIPSKSSETGLVYVISPLLKQTLWPSACSVPTDLGQG